MDITSLYYFAELAKDLHMTRTANRLFISQQTLSNHIQRLEDYFGTPLLYRKPTLSLTTAGEFVLAFANVVNKEERNLQDILNDVKQQERGTIRVGASTLRANACLPAILPDFSKRYPNVEIRIVDNVSRNLVPQVVEGDLDFAVVTAGDKDPKLVEWDLMKEQIYLCVRNDLLEQHYGSETEALKDRCIREAHLKDFERLPMCMLSNGIGMKIQRCYEEQGIKPNIYASSSDTGICLNLCVKGLAAAFVPLTRLVTSSGDLPADMNIFPLYDHEVPMVQKFSLIRHKDRYLSHYARLFQELLLNYFSEMETIDLARKSE